MNKGDEPKAEDSIANKDDLPKNTDYTWKETPDTSKSGDHGATVVVTYPDGSKDEVEVNIHVNSDAESHKPQGQDQTVDKGQEPKAGDSIANKDDLPKNTDYTWKETPDTSKSGDHGVTVVVTYPDGSQDEVDVTIHVKEETPTKETDADKYDPKGQDQTVNKGDKPNAGDSIVNKDDLPKDTGYTWKDTPDTNTPGDHTATVVVTYPDGSKDEVEVNIHVKDETPTKENDADKYDPKGQDQTVNKGDKPNAGDSIVNKDDLPKDTGYTWKDTPDTNTPGDHTATVVVTYPDGSKDEVEVNIHVKEETPTKETDADKYDPKGQDQTVNKGDQPKAEDSIANKDDLPKDTGYTWKETPDTTKPGDHTATVVVTYPDGSKDEIPVQIHVTDDTPSKETDADKYDPKGQDQTVNKGDKPNAGDSIANKDDLPKDTGYTWKDTPDTNTPGDHTATVVVTYPDGSKDEVEVNIHVKEETPTKETDADKYDPKGQDQTVNKGDQPKAEDSIANKDDLPKDTGYTWKETPDTTKPGDHTATVVVTYPDGSKDEIPVQIHVTDDTPSKETDADKYDPKGQDQTVNKGDKPNAGDSIANKDDLPKDTGYTWKDTPDTNTPGDHTATVVVTYPDDSKDEIPVQIHVTDDTPTKETDADKYDPKGQDQTVNKGDKPNAGDSIANKDDLPAGTHYDWKDTPDTTTPGDHTATVVVTYPDGSKDEIPVQIHVTDDTPTKETDADKYDPKGQD
ncbi:Rib/alpha/Esp surface antigen-like repeat protein, partial [Lactobacillus colini]|nr:Rib/alpha/Esp surface antigen-like repeat protein [Lactobacillus colini]